MHAVHFFALLEQRSFRPFCDEWHDGDSWTTLTPKVNCPKCSLLLTLSVLSWGQASTTSVRGTISDPQGAVVSKATVEISSPSRMPASVIAWTAS